MNVNSGVEDVITLKATGTRSGVNRSLKPEVSVWARITW